MTPAIGELERNRVHSSYLLADNVPVTQQLHPRRLLTTRMRIVVALGLTSLALVQSVRGLYVHHAKSAWLLGTPLLHGWALITVNVVLYAYICWLAFWFIRGTVGKERFFIVGWFLGLLLFPLRMLWPRSAVPIRQIGAFGLAVALLAALALLLNDSQGVDSGGTPDTA